MDLKKLKNNLKSRIDKLEEVKISNSSYSRF